MVDYNAALPQLAQFQAPNMLALAQQANQMQLGNVLMQEKQRGFQESNALRDLIAKGVDPTTPVGQQAIVAIAPNAGPAFVKAHLDILGQQRANQTALLGQEEARGRIAAQTPALQKSQIEAATQALTFHKDLLPTVSDQASYDIWRANTIKDLPGYDSQIPKVFTPDTKTQLMSTAAKIVDEANLRSRPSVQTFGENAYVVNPSAATAQPITVGGAAPAAPATDTYGARTAQIEGAGKNPNSSAQGKFQFIDSTFVDTAKKVFPELANKTPDQILALRGQQLGNGTQIEDALEQRLRADNIAALTGAGIQPTAGNTYLAHFLGAGGATKLLGADPNTPVSQILDPKAIAANESILKDKTAGQVAAWANGKYSGAAAGPPSMTMGQQFAIPNSVPGGLNALAPMAAAAPVANALVAPQQTPLSLNPSIPSATPGTPISTTKPPEGYTRDAQGGFKIIPGGPADPAVIAAKQAATTTATKTAENQAKAADTLPKLEENIRTISSALDQMIGKTTVDAKGHVIQDKNAPLHPGFSAAVGFSPSKWISKEPIQGTDRADFEQLYKQVQGGAFLDAYNTLRGGGSITEKEGEKATAAKNAMSLATSEKAFIKAANEYRGALTRGLELMRQQAAGGAAPAAPAASTSTTKVPSNVSVSGW